MWTKRSLYYLLARIRANLYHALIIRITRTRDSKHVAARSD